MKTNLFSMSLMLACASASLGLASAAQTGQLTTNGGFEAGDTSGWQSFPSATSTFNATMDANSGSFGGEIMNSSPASAAIIKQANLGVGSIQPGDAIRISFAAKGSNDVGGVFFAEFFSEIAGGGVSSSEFLGGGPIFSINADWQNYCFTTVAGPDVSGGVTLQIAAITGGATGSFSNVSIDDVSVTIEELTVNGGFESGDTSGWQSFPTALSTFEVTADANTGSFGAEIMNPNEAAAAVVKQANLGAGYLTIGETVNVSFAAKGELGVGGVIFAEFFTEIAGGGVSSSQLLGGAPVPINADWQTFNFAVPIGADVSGGVTLQIVAVTGAVTGSFANVSLDDVSVQTTSGTTLNFCSTSPNSVGTGAVMSSSGSPSVGMQDFTIEASGMPADTFGLFFVGLTTANSPSFDGTQCIGDVCRIGPIFSTSATGTASRTMTDGVYTQFGCTPPMVGTLLNFQAAYRDSQGSGGNWTDGLCVVFGQ